MGHGGYENVITKWKEHCGVEMAQVILSGTIGLMSVRCGARQLVFSPCIPRLSFLASFSKPMHLLSIFI
jgi:hypothetical protein